MENKEFSNLEERCRMLFAGVGKCFHVCSQEGHPVIFHNQDEFVIGMNAVAFAAFLCPDIVIYTFEVMDNHFHFVMAGEEERLRVFIRNLVARLASAPGLDANNVRNLDFAFQPVDGLDKLRNVIAYVNRNGAVVCPDENVFTYRWGANRFFFNREARLRFFGCGRKPTFRECRSIFHSDQLAKEEGIRVLDGYVSPLCFCDIDRAELFFRNNRHYFYAVSRNVEGMKDIAESIGEGIFYTDEDLFALIKALCFKKYACQSVAVLPREAKVELAKELRFKYNASDKQICRLLKMDLAVVSALFPRGV